MGEKTKELIHINGEKSDDDISSKYKNENMDIYTDINVLSYNKILHKKDTSPLEYLKESYPADIEKVMVDDIFYSKIYVDFIKYCSCNEIITLYDLSDNHIESFLESIEDSSDRNKIGFKIENVLEDMKESFNRNFFELDYLKDNYEEILRKSLIELVFDARKYLLFREFCAQNGIVTLMDLRKEDLVRFTFSKSIGKRKKEEIILKIEHFLLEILGDDQDGSIFEYIKENYPEDLKELKINDVFKEYKHIMFRIHCEDNDIISLYDLNIAAQKEYFQKFSIKDSKKKLVINALKKEYLSIIKKNLILSSVIPQEKEVGVDECSHINVEKNYFRLIPIESLLPDKYLAYEYMKQKLQDDGVENLLDLMGYDLTKLKYVPGVGEKRYSEFFDHLKENIRSAKETVKVIETEKFLLEDNIYSAVAEKTVWEVVSGVGLKVDRKSYNQDEISQYQGMRYIDIKDYSLIRYLINIKKNLEKIINVEETINELRFSGYNDVEKMVLYDRVIAKKPLEQISKSTGEDIIRLEKIEKSIIENINKVLKEKKFTIALRTIYDNYKRMPIEKLDDYLGENEKILLDLIKANVIYGVFYIKEYESMAYFNLEGIASNADYEIEQIDSFGEIKSLKKIFKKYNQVTVNDTIFTDIIKNSECARFMRENGVQIVDDYYYKDGISKIDLFEFYLKYYHKEPLRLNSKTVPEYNRFFKEKFAIEMKMNSRSLEGLASRSDKIILVNPRTYSHIDLVDIDEVTVLHMKKILDLRLSKKNYVNAKEIYEIMEEYYPGTFYGKHHVYSLINHHFDDYNTSKGNSLDITTKGNQISMKTDVIFDICKENDSIISIKDLKDQTDWSTNRIYNAIDNSERVIKMGPSKCVIIEDILNKEIKEKIKNISLEAFQDGYAFTKKLYSEYILKDEVLSDFVDKYDIKHPKEIASLIKYMNENIVGNNNFLYCKNQDIKSIEDVIRIKYPKYLTVDDLRELLSRFGYSQISIYQTVDRIVNKGIYIQVDKEKFLVKEKFLLDAGEIEKLVKFAKEKTSKNGYFIPKEYIKEIRNNIDFKDFEINQFTVANVLDENGFKKLFRYKMKNAMDVIVLVNKSSEYEDIDELTYDILKNSYDGDMNERDVYDFLSGIGIYEPIEDPLYKKMYNDMKMNGYISVDDEGSVVLK
ncbi:MAG: hypothetical protein RR561_00440 [Peptostreptococcus sp.]|uniref:hypothetical protein n=1 Tax=Peptostreptococcus sp. TaxID=1262 RepID=UPI002FCC075A